MYIRDITVAIVHSRVILCININRKRQCSIFPEARSNSCKIYWSMFRSSMYSSYRHPHSNGPGPSDVNYFNWLVVVVQVLGVASIIVTAIWMGHYRGGFAWQSDPKHEFNYHPLFMVTGMVFLYADAILAYRVFRHAPKNVMKIFHASMHISALVFASVGLKAVFDSHNLNKEGPIPNLYSLHSWLGLFVVICFGLQWLMSFVTFLWPKLSMDVRTKLMPYHTFFGVTLLVLATATALMGITEKAIFNQQEIDYAHLSLEGVLINFLGFILVTFTSLVVFLVTKPAYKRQPTPDEGHFVRFD